MKKWLDKYAEGGEGPDPIRRPDPRYPQPTSNDSLRLYNSQMALNKFYENELKAGRLKKQDTRNLSYLNYDFFQPRLKDLKQENIDHYRDDIDWRNKRGRGLDDKNYKKYYNLSPEQLKQLELKGLGYSKGGNEYQVYYRDVITPQQNLASPFALADSRIIPQRQINYDPIGDDVPGNIVTVYDYDPLAIKPWAMKTPQERLEWQKKHGKGIQTDKPQAKKQIKQENPTIKVGNRTGKMSGDTFVFDKPKVDSKPKVPVKLKPEPTLPRIDFAPMEKLEATRSATPSLSSMPSLNIPQPQNEYRVEYENPEKPGTYIHQDFPSEKLGTRFQQSLQGNRKGYYIKYKDGGELNYNDASVSLPDGFVGMGYNTQGRNYSPAWGGQFAMGGSLPGAVGFTYARTGSIPSNGPYAKKTKASAENGKEMSYYQNGLDWKPKNISRNGSDVPKNQNAKYIIPSESTALAKPKFTEAQYAEQLDQLNKKKEFEKYITSQPQIKQGKKEISNTTDNSGRSFWETASQFIPVYEQFLDIKDIVQGAFTGDTEMRNRGILGTGAPVSGKALMGGLDYLTEKTQGKETADYNEEKRKTIVNSPTFNRALFEKYGWGGYDKWVKAGKPPLYKQGGVIKDDRGQWAHPGEITEIGSNRITMQGVPYPVLGISDEGDQQMMYPEQEYKFKGKKVTEYPMKKANGGWLDKYN